MDEEFAFPAIHTSVSCIKVFVMAVFAFKRLEKFISAYKVREKVVIVTGLANYSGC